jgi:hypothetical protein
MALEPEEAAQHRAVGNVLLGMGACSAFVSIIGLIMHIELRFIDAPTMAVLGFVIMALGLWQRGLGLQ